MILVYGGLRWGEAVALRRASCNLLRSRLLVTESLSEVNGVLHFGPTKTHQRRSVSLPSFLCERLREHLDSEFGTSDDSLVFTSDRGAPVRYSNFRNRVWLPATRAAGLERHRHTHRAADFGDVAARGWGRRQGRAEPPGSPGRDDDPQRLLRAIRRQAR